MDSSCIRGRIGGEVILALLTQVLDTFKVAAELGPESLSAYVISMATNASDVLAVELLKREASLVVSAFRQVIIIPLA